MVETRDYDDGRYDGMPGMRISPLRPAAYNLLWVDFQALAQACLALGKQLDNHQWNAEDREAIERWDNIVTFILKQYKF